MSYENWFIKEFDRNNLAHVESFFVRCRRTFVLTKRLKQVVSIDLQ